MAEVGVAVQKEDFAPETGEYRHTACGALISLCRNNRIPPCYSKECPDKDQGWILKGDQREAPRASTAP
jgi:hypothetical protein